MKLEKCYHFGCHVFVVEIRIDYKRIFRKLGNPHAPSFKMFKHFGRHRDWSVKSAMVQQLTFSRDPGRNYHFLTFYVFIYLYSMRGFFLELNWQWIHVPYSGNFKKKSGVRHWVPNKQQRQHIKIFARVVIKSKHKNLFATLYKSVLPCVLLHTIILPSVVVV